ncbi:MAG: hypothetical protein CMJ47_02880 [Planctomyces sp.]|nr:hypothetical protein [Planctomyces sp.]
MKEFDFPGDLERYLESHANRESDSELAEYFSDARTIIEGLKELKASLSKQESESIERILVDTCWLGIFCERLDWLDTEEQFMSLIAQTNSKTQSAIEKRRKPSVMRERARELYREYSDGELSNRQIAKQIAAKLRAERMGIVGESTIRGWFNEHDFSG